MKVARREEKPCVARGVQPTRARGKQSIVASRGRGNVMMPRYAPV